MFDCVKKIKLINSDNIDLTDTILREIQIQKIASSYGFSPKILSASIVDDEYHIVMEQIDAVSLAEKYGIEPNNIPMEYWTQIKSMLNLLFDMEGIEYVDISPHNFIEINNKIYLINFTDAFYTSKSNSIPTNLFLKNFLDKSKQIFKFI